MTTDDALDAFARFERDGWQRAAPTYHEDAAPLVLPFAEALIDALGDDARGRLLDLAAGPGYIAGLAAERGADAIGTDIAQAMLDEAARLFPGVRFQLADAEQLPFADGDFTAVTIGFGVLHFARPERALSEAFRVLRPGGRLAYTNWTSPAVGSGGQQLMQEALLEHGNPTAASLPPAPDGQRLSDAEEASRVLTRLGFEEPSISTIEIAWQLATPSELIDFFSAGVRMGPLLRAQTADELSAIRTALEARLQPYRNETGFAIPMAAVLVMARKPPEE